MIPSRKIHPISSSDPKESVEMWINQRVQTGWLVRLAVLIISLFGWPCLAQNEVPLYTWTDLNYTYGFNTTWGTGGDAGIRGALTNPEATTIYARPILIYRNTDDLNFGLSLGFFQNLNANASNSLEIRPAQQVNLVWPEFKNWSLKSRLRTEQRYFTWQDNGLGGIAGNGWQFRGRYELKFKTEPFTLIPFMKNTYVLMSGEYFVPFGRKVDEVFADQSRLLVGFGHEVGERWTYECHFFWQRNRTDDTAVFQTDQYVLRLRFFLRNKPREFVEED